MLREALDAKRIAITGSTGFLGTALTERVLRCLPNTEVVLLVRPGRRGAAERVRRDVLGNDCFDRLRHELGTRFDEEVARRVVPLAGDVTVDGLGLDAAGRRLLASCTAVVHSAATVNFDSPLDAAVEVNLLGPSRVARVLLEAAGEGALGAAGEGALGAAAREDALQDLGKPGQGRPLPGASGRSPLPGPGGRSPFPEPGQRWPLPHLIAVSTAYVAGGRRGLAPEAPLSDTPFSPRADWRAEVEAARRARSDSEAASRDPKRLARFRSQARAELGAAGVPLLAEKTERLRTEWADDRMVELGKARAQALGWPDAYAYSKALGEWALLEARGDLPVTLVRPSIIEAALAQPVPGWTRGFRMADPIIISYARGLLREFPGIPEGIVDVIPVDLVVAAILAVAARGPLAEPDVVHAASGARNPLRYGQLVSLVRHWFSEHPLADDKGQPIEVPQWTFPGRRRVQRQLHQATTAMRGAEKLLQALPLRGSRAELAARVEQRHDDARRALGYVELYGSYTETEAVFSVGHLLQLAQQLSPDERHEFCLDPAVVDWPSYCHGVYLPAVVAHSRVPQAGLRRRPRAGLSREQRARHAVLSPERQLAVFDLENTLVATNVVDSYAWLASRPMEFPERARFVVRTLLEAPRMLHLDNLDRGDFLRWFYRRYEAADFRGLSEEAWEMTSDLLFAKAFPAGIRRVREHRALGHRTLLITGALDFLIEPFKPLFDDVVCAHMRTSSGQLSGELDEVPPTGEARALLMADYAAAHGLDMSQCVAYADSTSDLPMLEAAGFPVAVNPETKLASIARKRGWLVEQWSRAPGFRRALLPFGSVRSAGRLLRPPGGSGAIPPDADDAPAASTGPVRSPRSGGPGPADARRLSRAGAGHSAPAFARRSPASSVPLSRNAGPHGLREI
jgi:fatty acyl-CoA reductase